MNEGQVNINSLGNWRILIGVDMETSQFSQSVKMFLGRLSLQMAVTHNTVGMFVHLQLHFIHSDPIFCCTQPAFAGKSRLNSAKMSCLGTQEEKEMEENAEKWWHSHDQD